MCVCVRQLSGQRVNISKITTEIFNRTGQLGCVVKYNVVTLAIDQSKELFFVSNVINAILWMQSYGFEMRFWPIFVIRPLDHISIVISV